MSFDVRIAEAFGLTVEEGQDVVEAAEASVDTLESPRDVHGQLRAIYAELRSQAAESADAGLVALAGRVAALAGMVSDRVKADVEIAEQAASLPDDLGALPEVADTAVTADTADTAVTADTGEAETAEPVETPPVAVAPPAPVAVVDEPSEPDVFVPRGTLGELEPLDTERLGELIAASVHGTGGQGEIARVRMERGVAVNTVMAASLGCPETQTFGNCRTPAVDETRVVCGSEAWPESAAYGALGVAREAGQNVLRYAPLRLRTGTGFEWGSADWQNLLLRDANGDLILDADGRPQPNPNGPEKDCAIELCSAVHLDVSKFIGACTKVATDLDAASADAVRARLTREHIRHRAAHVLGKIAEVANWVDTFPVREAQNFAATLTSAVATAVVAQGQQSRLGDVQYDLFAPYWLPHTMIREGWLADRDMIDEWTEIVTQLRNLGITVRFSLDNIGGTSAADLSAAGYSDWAVPAPDAGGTIASASALVPLPSRVPLFLAPAGTFTVETQPFVSINMTGAASELVPIGDTELRKNCRTMFMEEEVLFTAQTCADVLGLLVCIDPLGKRYQGAALPPEAC